MRSDGKVPLGRQSFLPFLCLLAAGGLLPPARAAAPREVDFAHEIVPLLKARCARCHTNGKYKGSLSLDTREDILKANVVVPGKSGDSELFKRITSDDPSERMPPKGKRLSAPEVQLI